MQIELIDAWELKGSYSGFWKFGRSMELSTELKGFMDWIPAEVPGSVHWDLHKAGLLPDPYYDRNTTACEWVNDRDWMYRTAFTPDSSWKGKRIRLVCEGIDESAEVFVNGRSAGSHRGMFSSFETDITGLIEWDTTNRLLVAIRRSPEGEAQLGSTGKVNHLKSRFGYKWDFCPRLIHIGLWKPVRLSVDEGRRIEDVHVVTEKEGSSVIVSAAITLECDRGGEANLAVRLAAPEGEVIWQTTRLLRARPGHERISFRIPVEEPEWWWPNNEGEQPLYRLEVELSEEAADAGGEHPPQDSRSVTFGIRTVTFAQNPGSPLDAAAYTVTVNDRTVYLKGWNWVPVDQLYGRDRTEKLERLIRLARAANVNLLRVWGGGLIESETFYELCDRNGIMVWQEMMQSSSGFDNEPSREDSFLHLLTSTMRQAIRQKRNHASLIIWCGGNELTTGGHLDEKMKPLTDEHPAMEALRDLISDLDPGRLFLSTSPLGPSFFLEASHSGRRISYDVHGPWKYAGAIDHYTLYNGSDALLQSEFGGDGWCSLSSMARFLPAERIRSEETGSWSWVHHGYEYWNMDVQLEELFGPIGELAVRVQASQWLQAEGIRYALEANRRRAPFCSGSILWQMNEPFPNVSCTSAIDYFGDPKLAYSWTASANRPVHVSMQYHKAAYKPGETFIGAVHLCIDRPDSMTDVHCACTVELLAPSGKVLLQQSFPGSEDRFSLVNRLGVIRWEVPPGIDAFYSRISVELGEIHVRNEYAFAVSPDGPPLSGHLRLGGTTLMVSEDRVNQDLYRITVVNSGAVVASWVRVEGKPVPSGVEMDLPCVRPLEDGFLLFPGEQRSVDVQVERAADWTWSAYALNAMMR